MTANIEMIKKNYSEYKDKIAAIRKVINHPLTYSEKVLYVHLWERAEKEFVRGKDYVELVSR